MKKLISTILLCCLISSGLQAQEKPARIRLTDVTLMHEMRATPSPSDKATVSDRAVSFQWPLRSDINTSEAVLDGMKSNKKKVDKSHLKYRLRYSQDAALKNNVTQEETRWPFFNPEKDLATGVWYWQYGYVNETGKTQWSSVLQFTVKANPDKFCPPSFKTMQANLSKNHPRILVQKDQWADFMKSCRSKAEYQWYLEKAKKVLKTPMQSVNDINTKLAAGLKSEMQRNAMLTRESRRIIDNEESNVELLIRAYLLTQDTQYSKEAIKRILEMVSWDENENVKGDFNASTMLSLSSLAYDSFYNLLDEPQKQTLLKEIKKRGSEFYASYNNHLENHIADNHVWQMTLRIFTFAAFSVYGDLPEADIWADYCYNLWLARFPGLNKDGAWHNGDSYFTVNTRTLIEVPYFYTTVTGFNFFNDPWYQGSALYTIYQQPPFSKSGGNGSGHQGTLKPSSIRVGYADALARMTGNTYAADYVRRIATTPDFYKRYVTAKAGSLAWFRLQCDKPLPEGEGLANLPMGYVFPESGLASFMTNWERVGSNAMFSFRSSPYGSTSHAIANQNAFNTFFGGSSLFYSSGHHISFVDKHSMLCHRSTRAHNTILVNGMGQRIGTEGYGWIPRYYVGEKIGYLLGDASNAYGKVISPLWLERGIEYTPANGWDKNHLKTFRRHTVALGKTGLVFIYDELEADEPVTWDYLLHTVINPMNVTKKDKFVHIQATNKNGASDAYLFSSGTLKTDTTSQFFVPAVNWLRADAKGKFAAYPNHWHFTATSEKQKTYRFATIINTHPLSRPVADPEILPDGRIKAGSWIIKVNVSAEGTPSFFIRSTRKGEDVNITYKGGATIVREDGYETTLVDKRPELEI
jgi:hypothetical protein